MIANSILNASVGAVIGTALWLTLLVSLTALGLGDWVWQHCQHCLVGLLVGGGAVGMVTDAFSAQARGR
ncbi:MAG: hypothetical protein ACFCUG_12065 [Thiotrichales bacterium]